MCRLLSDDNFTADYPASILVGLIPTYIMTN